ncbi:hypothetical protein [Pontibacter pamirensis]|uniref:hypothetical protein n=1 Tax=Pontibacter pamirensis TaxID=2562824 RepID=UPI001389E15F|nr:hypothetical protein [Pontibacter pamirensis]
MEVYSTSSVAVKYVQGQGRLYLQCCGNFNSREFRESLLVALQFAADYHVKQWLLDYRAIGALSEEEETWLHTHLFPRIMMTMGTDNYVAVVLAEKCYQALLSEAGLYGLQSFNSFIIMNTFSQTSDAVAWLDSSMISHAS